MDFYQTDCEALLLQIRRQQKLLKSKRRWLLGLPTSVSRLKHSDHSDFLSNRNLPEFLLREDDVFYETVRTRVEEAFGVLNVEKRHVTIQADKILDACKLRRLILSCLDDLSTKGLYLLAIVLTEETVEFEKSRWKLKGVIREYLPKVLNRKNQDHHQLKIVKQLSQLLNEPQNFRRRCLTSLTSSSLSYHDAASEVLYRLEDLPTQGLLAMRRKLKGVRVMPQIKRHRHGWARERLINILTETSKKMLSTLDEGDELQESLAKAMAVANLSLKLVPGCHNSSLVEFYPFPPQIKTLHNEIVKAIWFISKRGNFQKLKKLQSLLDPAAKVSNRCLRTAIKKMLIEYLFECSDMETVPKSLLKALAIMNAGSQSSPPSFFSQEEIEKEVECVLCLSAQIKQIVWDVLPDYDFDSNFADAYMEELEESDDDIGDNDNDSDGLPQEDSDSYTNDHVEGTGESIPSNLEHLLVGNVMCPTLGSLQNVDVESFQKSEHMHFTGENSLDSSFGYGSPFLESKFQKDAYNVSCNQQMENMDTSVPVSNHKNGSPSRFTPNTLLDNSAISTAAKTPCLNSFNKSCAMPQMETNKPSTIKNQYLVIQEACDEMSMITYNFIGRLLEEFAKSEGLDLDWCENLYLNSDCSIDEDCPVPKDEQTNFKENVNNSAIIQVCEELIPSLPESAKKSLKQMLGM